MNMCEQKKVCTSCKVEKPLDDFHNSKNGKFGKAYTCKVCKNDYCKIEYHNKKNGDKRSTKKEVTEGEVYGYYTIIKEVEPLNKARRVLCSCRCGTIKEVNLKSIQLGTSKSCGCYRKNIYSDKYLGEGNPGWKGGKVVSIHGYIDIMINGKYVKEHRWLYEQHYGIKLLPHQTIHHINGIRTDNRIENLELWDTSQPKGQRIDDKINFYFNLLKEYREHPLYKELIEKQITEL